MVHVDRRGVWRAAMACVAATSMAATPPPTAPAAAGTAPDSGVPFICDDGRPAAIDPGSYGMQLDGSFRHPLRHAGGRRESAPVSGRARRRTTLTRYLSGMKVEARLRRRGLHAGSLPYLAEHRGLQGSALPFPIRSQRRPRLRHHRRAARCGRAEASTATSQGAVGRQQGKVRRRATGRPTISGARPAFNGTRSAREYIMVQSFEQKRQISEIKAEPPDDKFSNPVWRRRCCAPARSSRDSRSLRCAARASRTGNCSPPSAPTKR